MGKNITDQVLDKQDKDGMLRRALERIIQLYTDKSHFVYELLQNAEDAGASEIKFDQYDDRLEVYHNGRPFTLENLAGLCDIGKSDKINDYNQIGEFGVGFKSVFGICEIVKLYSHPKEESDIYPRFATEIHDFTHPISIEDQEFDNNFTTKYVFPYVVGYSFSGYKTIPKLKSELSRRLKNLGVTTLLFMKNLKSITYSIDTLEDKITGSYYLDKKEIDKKCSLVSAIGRSSQKEEVISYLVYSKNVTGLQVGRTIDIAYAVSIDENENYNFIPAKTPYISVYFPTETESKLKFIVQGPYRTTPNRSSVPADDAENIRLANLTSQLLRESVTDLKKKNKLNFSLLNILPTDEKVFENASLFSGLFDQTKQMMMEEELLPCKNGQYAKVDNVKISRGNEFAEILTDQYLTELIDDKKEYHWLPTFLTETNKTYAVLYKFLIDELNIDVIRPENLRNMINANERFLYNRDDEWLIKFYNMYASVGAAFSKQKGGTNMLTATFIKTTTGKFLAPYRKTDGSDGEFYHKDYDNANYIPNLYILKGKEPVDGINYVDEYIYSNCKQFFNEILGLTKPDEYEFFKNDFIKRCSNFDDVSESQRVKDILSLVKYRNNTEYKSEIEELIKKYVFLRCIKNGKVIYINTYKEKVFFTTDSDGLNIEQYYKNIVTYAYVDDEYYLKNGINRDVLLSLNVLDNISKNKGVVSGYYNTGNSGRVPEWNSTKNFYWKLSLDRLSEVLQYINTHPNEPNSMAKSSYIFRFLKNNEIHLSGDIIIGGNTPNKYNEYSDIIVFLKNEGPKHLYYGLDWNGRWLYTKDNVLVSHSAIHRTELNTHLYGEIDVDSKIYDILGFAKSNSELLEETTRKYDKFSDETKSQFFEIELRRRYGLSVIDLDENFKKISNISTYEEKRNDEFDFPSARVRNWDTLRKHVAEALSFAAPVKYEKVIRSVRTSQSDIEIKAYLKGMYTLDGTHQYVCQICHNRISNFEKCQLITDMEKEIDCMYLCVCANCHTKFRKILNVDNNSELLYKQLEDISQNEIIKSDPVIVDFNDFSIWFTQTHMAEIVETIALKEEVLDREQGIYSLINHNKDKKDKKSSESAKKKTNNKFSKGMTINHHIFGIGKIIRIRDDIMIVNFGSKYGEKSLSVSLCMNNDKITIIQ